MKDPLHRSFLFYTMFKTMNISSNSMISKRVMEIAKIVNHAFFNWSSDISGKSISSRLFETKIKLRSQLG